MPRKNSATHGAPEGKSGPSARERLLEAANQLFYEEGVHTVGIDRIIERAGVAKASLYSTYGSKDELVRAYLLSRHERRKQRLSSAIARVSTPRDQILAIFDSMAELFSEPTYRGCAFARAVAEASPESSARQVVNETRAWTRALFGDLARATGAADPDGLARRLVLLYDGTIVSAQLDGGPASAHLARTMAEELLDAQRLPPAR